MVPESDVDIYVLHCLAGYWNVTVYGRKHCYRLYTKLLNEATRWSSAIQNVTDTKAPIDTPTQQLIQDIKVRREAQELLVKSSLGRKDCRVLPVQLMLAYVFTLKIFVSIEVLEFGTLYIDRRVCVNWLGTT